MFNNNRYLANYRHTPSQRTPASVDAVPLVPYTIRTSPETTSRPYVRRVEIVSGAYAREDTAAAAVGRTPSSWTGSTPPFEYYVI